MKGLALLGLALLAACAAASPPVPTASSVTGAWLIGTWLFIEPGQEPDLACASGLPITYRPNGTYSLPGEIGTWRLVGNRITERATAATATQVEEPHEVAIGQRFVSTIERAGAHKMWKTFADGTRGTLFRCPSRQ